MGRRTSGQTVGYEKIGNVQANQATLTTTQTNSNLSLSPNGTGMVMSQSDVGIAAQKTLQLYEATANGTNYMAQRAAANMTSNYTITWPSAVSASAGYVLSSDASGNLSWTSPSSLGISVSDPGASSTVYYPIFGTNGGAVPTTLSPNARSNLAFVPSTGELTATVMSAANMYGGTGASGTLTIRGTSSGTKATASILMTDNVSSSSTATGTLVVTGGVGVSGQLTAATVSCTTLNETSSIALKENVNPISNALDAILQLVGVTYDRRDGSSKGEAGLIAEEVYKTLPNLVQLDENGKPLGVKYTKLTAYLIESIRTLKEEINELKGK